MNWNSGIPNLDNNIDLDIPKIEQNFSFLKISVIGMKRGLEIYYFGADDIRIHPGQIHVNDGNDHFIRIESEIILSSIINLSLLSGWYYVYIDGAGVVTLGAGTGDAPQRPTDLFFQWSGYDHVRQGYYNGNKRIIGAISRVDAYNWYIINCGIYVTDIDGSKKYEIKVIDGSLALEEML